MVLEQLSKSMFDLFVIREDVYAKQFKQKNGKKGYKCIKQSLNESLIIKHLELDNNFQLGTYNLDTRSLVKWGCLDFDLNTKEDFDNAKELYIYSLSKGFHPLLEKSGGGEYKVHIWFFSDELIPSKQMVSFLNNLCKEKDIFPHEIFPKQEKIGDYGNLVKIPLGLNFSTGEKSILLTQDGELTKERDILEKVNIHIKFKDRIPLEIIQETPSNNLNLLNSINPNKINVGGNPNKYDPFFDYILNNELPEGSSQTSSGKITGVNDNVIKNLAMYLKIKGYDMASLESDIKPNYDKRGWSFGGLRGWFKKADIGDIMEISEKELKKWASIYKKELVPLLEVKPISIESKEIEVLTFNDFRKLKRNNEFIVEDFLNPGTITMLYSPPGQFKSILALTLGMTISNGKEWMGFKTKKKGVLYLDGENSNNIIKERLEQAHKGYNIKRNKFPLFIIKNGYFMDPKKNINTEYLDQLRVVITKNKIKVLFVDTLHRFAFYDENKADDINLMYTKVFKPLVDEFNLAVVFLHHSTKSGGYRGSGDFLGMVDVSYQVRREGKTDKFNIINEKCRSGEIADLRGEVDFQEDSLRIHRLDGKKEDGKKINKLKEVTHKVKALFEEGIEFERKDIIGAFEIEEYNFGSTKTIDRSLKWLIDKNILDKDKRKYHLI